MNTLKLKLIALGPFLLSLSAFAAAGSEARPGGQASSCRLLERDSAGKLMAICSATLTSTNQVTTAAHCIDNVRDDQWSVTIECGYQGVVGTTKVEVTAGGSQVLTQGPQFKEKRSASEIQLARAYDPATLGHDLARISFSPPITSMPSVSVAKSESDLENYFEKTKRGNNPVWVPKNGVSCISEGYGISPLGQSGALWTVPVEGSFYFDSGTEVLHQINPVEVTGLDSKSQLKFVSAQAKYEARPTAAAFIPVLKAASKFVKTLPGHGDSGGPLYCRTSATSSWQLVGINGTSGLLKTPEGYVTRMGWGKAIDQPTRELKATVQERAGAPVEPSQH